MVPLFFLSDFTVSRSVYFNLRSRKTTVTLDKDFLQRFFVDLRVNPDPDLTLRDEMDSRRAEEAHLRSSASGRASHSNRNSIRLPGVSMSSRTSSVARERIELQADRASTIDTRSITSVYNDWCEADDGHAIHSINGHSEGMREETGTLHSVPMITNDEHDYGSRNFNTRDSNTINPVRTRVC